MIKKTLYSIAVVSLAAASYFTLAYQGYFGHLEVAGSVTPVARPILATQQQFDLQQQSAIEHQLDNSQILFGDLHVHTTYSIDAFQASLALMGGEGAHPPADACDFARYCSALDFWSINDHAENITLDHWNETKDSIRQCNAVAGDPKNPDMVAFTGFEWTHAGLRPEDHYGHKNVMFRETAEAQLPSRPIFADSPGIVNRSAKGIQRLAMPLLEFGDRQRAYDFNALTDAVYSVPTCEEGVDVRELPLDCREGAKTPKELFGKLDQWGFDTMVIPHGNTWGIYTPPATTWDKQLKAQYRGSNYQFLMEAYSGHGNAEPYRDWRGVIQHPDGSFSCPVPTQANANGEAGYTPSCWKAGEIIQQRCESEGGSTDHCAQEADDARQIYADNGIAGHNVLGGQWEEWLTAGQCTDCFLPAFNYRPGGSYQYALSLTNFDDPQNPARFDFGFIASSDNHQGRPGAGYKEFDRYEMTETAGVQSELNRKAVYPKRPWSAKPQTGDFLKAAPVKKMEHERSSSFFYTGGLVAVHANGRDRDSIWNALENKQVYGTSGERMLLWFDLLNSDDGKKSMGQSVNMNRTPTFRVSAVGAFKQKPGCPDYVSEGLTSERMETLCRGECYHPGDERKLIKRIEIIRIRPQMIKDEAMFLANGESRIESVWKSFECERDQNGCSVEFSDPEFSVGQRDFTYYARAIQEAAPVINGDNLRPKIDDNGQVIEVQPCYSDNRTNKDSNCLAMKEARAWSSPIFIHHTLNTQPQ